MSFFSNFLNSKFLKMKSNSSFLLFLEKYFLSKLVEKFNLLLLIKINFEFIK